MIGNASTTMPAVAVGKANRVIGCIVGGVVISVVIYAPQKLCFVMVKKEVESRFWLLSVSVGIVICKCGRFWEVAKGFWEVSG